MQLLSPIFLYLYALFRKTHILFFLVAVLILSFQRTHAAVRPVPVNSTHQSPDNISHLHNPVTQQIIEDILTDSSDDEGDDETSSKSKHRTPKIATPYPIKLDSFVQHAVLLLFDPFSLHASAVENKYSGLAHHFSKTSISIAICCLRI